MPKSIANLAQFETIFVFAWGIAFAVVLMALSAPGAGAAGGSFREDFVGFDSTRWLKSDFQQGYTDYDPNNVVVENDLLKLKVPSGYLDPEETLIGGAQIESREYYGYGTFRARMRVADAPSSITGFYLYRSPDLYSEIDIEVYNDGTGEMDLVTYADGQRTNYVSKDFRFDPSAEFHNYRIDYNPDSVKFYIDGNLRQMWTEGIPSASMKLLVNTWFPSWLGGQAPETARATRVDWIDYDQR